MTQQRPPAIGLAWADAYAAARDLPTALPAETCAPEDAHGRTLAEPLLAAAPVPAFDAAAMDGYAVAGPGPWQVAGLILAGTPDPALLAAGTAAEIATGAPVPANTEAVLPYEDCHVDGATVHGARGPRTHIRRAGDDVEPGALIVPAGRTLTATRVAAAVQAGVEQVRVHRRPSVTLLVTGDEVVLAGRPGPGQVRDSFTGIVAAVTTRAGGALEHSRHVGDNPAELRKALDRADTDVIVVSGSSSAGAADHLHALLDERGAEWHVRGVASRPGHPQALASLPGGRWVVSLPGNPYAGMVSTLTLLEPLLGTLAGRPPATLPAVPVTGSAKLMPGGVRIAPQRNGVLLPPGGSAGLAAVADADSLAVLSDNWTEGDPAPQLIMP
ncbi:molybdopterin molybdotransferase MoeA [Paractinoplanes lichenicola]|uniref:molybdopterin molybdotransferase MoeA n=1 Tax=Paractinoplanes lichenicola TaxID=2802976 RepID=UPI0019324F07|nr:molybdopterin molybdotransferase MoeA [Actinoplanes lichenicola]